MDTAPATTTETTTEPTTAPRFAAIKARLSARRDDLQHRAKELAARAQGLQARAKDLPLQARARALALVARVRIALDLPSRTEIAELSARLDRLDARIAELSGAPVVASLAEQSGASDIPEESRKDKKRTHAAKQVRR
jgi:hypothetical protein